jgi:hypothetical protein
MGIQDAIVLCKTADTQINAGAEVIFICLEMAKSPTGIALIFRVIAAHTC